MPNNPAFPATEVSRHVVTSGLTAHEAFTLAALPACIATASPDERPEQTAARAKAFADAALSHRRAQP
ncbi:hypothetical protein ACN9JG_06135 [Cereibacter azotoformans]|uniref:hypothetical protein n=1 Tax=Cereibacter azotoformans TaxID=43057 RepID=UPI003B211BFF